MSDTLTVRPGERGVVRVFALDMEAGEARAFRAPGAIDAALGVEGVDPDHVDVFPAGDLEGLGLAGYLVEGCGIPEEAVAPDRARLEAERGHLMVVRSRAFRGRPARIAPAGQLRHIGTYSETPVDWSASGPIRSESALPGSGRATRPPRAHRVRTRWIGASVFTASAVLVLLVILLIVF